MKKVFRYKYLYIVFLLFFIVTISCVYIYYNRSITIQYFFTKTKRELIPESIVYLDQIGLDNITCTGITYSYNSNTFWIADFGAKSINSKRSPRLIEIDDSLNEIKKIVKLENLSDSINLQGIDFDDKTDTIWIATGDSIYNINKEGIIVKQIGVNIFNNSKSNGIYYDEENEIVFVLLTSKYLLKYDINGNLINKDNMNYFDQDHIFISNGSIFMTIGADYRGNNNFMLKIDDKEKSIFRMINSYAIEGLTIVDKKLYIMNDGYYHNAKINKSYIAVYDIDDF